MLEKCKVNEFVVQCGISNAREKVEKIDAFVHYLIEENQKVNLISRKTSIDDIWLLHILDSLLPLQQMDLEDKRILDFGSGGGLPGIPLKILYPGSFFYLLDSRLRKMEAVKKIIKKLDLADCITICSRLEDLDLMWNGKFDRILCRSVRIRPEFWFHLDRVLNEKGLVYLYKARKYEDVSGLTVKKIDISHQDIGIRTLIELKKDNVPRGT